MEKTSLEKFEELGRHRNVAMSFTVGCKDTSANADRLLVAIPIQPLSFYTAMVLAILRYFNNEKISAIDVIATIDRSLTAQCDLTLCHNTVCPPSQEMSCPQYRSFYPHDRFGTVGLFWEHYAHRVYTSEIVKRVDEAFISLIDASQHNDKDDLHIVNVVKSLSSNLIQINNVQYVSNYIIDLCATMLNTQVISAKNYILGCDMLEHGDEYASTSCEEYMILDATLELTVDQYRKYVDPNTVKCVILRGDGKRIPTTVRSIGYCCKDEAMYFPKVNHVSNLDYINKIINVPGGIKRYDETFIFPDDALYITESIKLAMHLGTCYK